jgi:predicted dehydrogenase
MIAAAQAAGRVYAVIQNRRYVPQIRRLRAFLDSGELGGVTAIHSDFFIGAHFGGFRDEMEHVLLMDMAIHTFDQARFLSRADPVSVIAHEWNPAGSWYRHGASAVAIFEMTGGIVYTYRGSWCAEGRNTCWDAEWRIIAERGTVCWDGADGFRVERAVPGGGFRRDVERLQVPPFDAGEKVEGHAGIIREFCRCARDGGLPETVCTDNIRSLEMVFGAVNAAKTGVRVRLGRV